MAVNSAKKLDGKLLELSVERLIKSCGFKPVTHDGLYVQQNGSGLRWVNGKGSSHDADVLLEPPFQPPFCYPTRLLVECKNLRQSVGLPLVRAGFGLREDINGFEVVTKDHLTQRRNTRRNVLAVEIRNRFQYQVAVASASGFTKPAIEFAINNKIPLIDVSRIVPGIELDLNEISRYSDQSKRLLLDYVNSKGFISIEDSIDPPSGLDTATVEVSAFNRLARKLSSVEEQIIVGSMESGEILFLVANSTTKNNLLELQLSNSSIIRCDIYYEDNSEKWRLVIPEIPGKEELTLDFVLPYYFFQAWANSSFDESFAIDMKEDLMKNITLYTIIHERVVVIRMYLGESWLREMRRLRELRRT
ncbi:MAG: hypothetical protein VKK04_20120 [Synechococcales bacterium]|nr:hypothetical protein [Synechococcales bacterium]